MLFAFVVEHGLLEHGKNWFNPTLLARWLVLSCCPSQRLFTKLGSIKSALKFMHDSELRTVFSIEEEDDHLKGFMFASCMKLFQKKLTRSHEFCCSLYKKAVCYRHRVFLQEPAKPTPDDACRCRRYMKLQTSSSMGNWVEVKVGRVPKLEHTVSRRHACTVR